MRRISPVRRIILAQISSSASNRNRAMLSQCRCVHGRAHSRGIGIVSSLSARRGPISHSRRRGEKRMKNFPPTNLLYNTRLRFSPEIPEIIDATGVMNFIYHAVLTHRVLQGRNSLAADRPRTMPANFLLSPAEQFYRLYQTRIMFISTRMLCIETFLYASTNAK